MTRRSPISASEPKSEAFTALAARPEFDRYACAGRLLRVAVGPSIDVRFASESGVMRLECTMRTEDGGRTIQSVLYKETL
jgi:hypothetical protein